VQGAFPIVIFAVVFLSAVIAIAGFASRSKAYDEIGKGGFSIDRSEPVKTTSAVRDVEIRQMLEASNARRVRRGLEPLDLEEELARLTRASVDPALEAEVRSLVVARNERRARKGLEPLDVEAEVRRQLESLR
jgi:hypothetical protein